MSGKILVSVFIILIASMPAWAGVRDGLVGYWPMDEGSGDKVADASGNGTDGTAKDTKWVDGKYDKALEFNGVASIVDIPYFAEITPVEGATMSAWVFPTDDTRSCIVGQFEAYGLALFNVLQLKSVTWGEDWVETSITIPQHEWSHLAMTWDINANHRTMVLNGELVAEKPNSIPVPQVQNNLGIGLWVNWPVGWGDDFFSGTIDDVKLWNRVLTADEVGEASLPTPVEPQGKLATVWGVVKGL
ncbi:LamG domain-containing protein [Candidatus Poribacteria bacterium]